MAIPEDIKSILLQFSSEAKRKFDIERVLLFGSYALGTPNDQSDIDIAIKLAFVNNGKRIHIAKELWMLAQKIDLRLEPKLFFLDDFDVNEPASLSSSIIRNGIEIN